MLQLKAGGNDELFTRNGRWNFNNKVYANANYYMKQILIMVLKQLASMNRNMQSLLKLGTGLLSIFLPGVMFATSV